MIKNKTDITINTYNNIVDEYIAYFKTRELPNSATILDAGTALGDYPKYLISQVDKDHLMQTIITFTITLLLNKNFCHIYAIPLR